MKILLNENAAAAKEIITNAHTAYSNGKTLLKTLSKIGLTVEAVNDWETIEAHFRTDYPKASLIFNLQANGIEQEYNEVKNFFDSCRGLLSYDPITAEQMEDIRESQKVYAERPEQIEAYKLLHEIKDNFNRLEQIGVKLNLNKLYAVNPMFAHDPRQQQPLSLEEKSLNYTLLNL